MSGERLREVNPDPARPPTHESNNSKQNQHMCTNYLVAQLVGVSFVHGFGREQKGIVCHLVSSVDILAISVAVGCHTDVVTVTETLGSTRDTSQGLMAMKLVMSSWINDSCNSRRQTSGKWFADMSKCST